MSRRPRLARAQRVLPRRRGARPAVPSRRRAIGPAWRWLAFAGMAGAAALAQVLPPGAGHPLTYLIEPVAGVAILVGTRFYRPANRRTWRLLACAAAASVAAPALVAIPHSLGLIRATEGEATAQVLSLLADVPLIAALVMFMRARTP